jgi:hypothetical protein
LATADAGVKQQADIHAIQVLLAVVDIAAVVQDADVLEVLAAQVLLHSPTLPVVVVAVVDTVQTSAGTVTQDILVVQAVADQLARTIVQHLEQAAAAVLVLTVRAIMVLAVAHTTATVPVQVDSLDQTVPAVFRANLGPTVKDTAITVVVTMVAVAVVVVHHMAADGVAKALSVLFGPAQREHIQTTQAKIFNIR